MKTENLSFVRSFKVPNPTKEEIEAAKEKANKNYQSLMGRILHVEPYTR